MPEPPSQDPPLAQRPPQITRFQWLSIVVWALLLIGIFVLLLSGPGLHGAFSQLTILTLFGLLVILLAGITFMCCYFGYDSANAFCFGPNMEKDEEQKIRQHQELQPHPNLPSNPCQAKGKNGILNIRNLHTPRLDHSNVDSRNAVRRFSLDSKVNGQVSVPIEDSQGPFTVQTTNEDLPYDFDKNGIPIQREVPHKLHHTVTIVRPRRQPPSSTYSDPRSLSFSPSHSPPPPQKQAHQPPPNKKKRLQNWFFSSDAGEDEDSFCRSTADIEAEFAARIKPSSTPICQPSRAPDTVEMIRDLSGSFSDVPEPFVYTTPIKSKKKIEDDLKIEPIS